MGCVKSKAAVLADKFETTNTISTVILKEWVLFGILVSQQS